MPPQITDFPQDPRERQIFDDAYRKGDGWIRLAAFLLPAVPFASFWWQIQDALGFEGAALMISALQIASVLFLPDRIMMHRARRALIEYRAAQPVDVEEGGPTASFHPENYR